jgi:ring-1,2-phenylacetyl-CoA epoxidase subunit PaaD
VIDQNIAHPSAHDVRAALARIPDPELPIISIVDLGIIGDVVIGPEVIDVAILPTFVGCPALDVIRSTIEDRLATEFARPVTVRTTFAVPWTSERISEAGRAALLRAGIAPPADPADVRCPHCASAYVAMDSAFGPTQCRSLFYCRSCRQPFEAMKLV